MRRGASLAIVLLGTACNAIWDAGNRSTAKADITGILQQHGIVRVSPDCHMSGTTRDFACDLVASNEEVARLAQGLMLIRVESVDPPRSELARLVKGKSHDCQMATRFGNDPSVTVFGLAGRPPQLRLSSGSALEYLLLYHDATSGRVCIEASYAYG